jgi:signal transduction histidine kinase/CheY-like chemotaxis protein
MTYSDGEVHTGVRRVARPAGEKHYEITASPLKGSSGETIAGIEVVRDITDRKKMERDMQRIQKLESLGVLAGGIAHDFNNLLTAILGNLSYVLSLTPPGEHAYERIEKAEKAALRAKDLTRQLQTFSKGGVPIKKITSIKQLIKESAGFGVRGSNVKCEFFIADDLWLAEVDEGQIIQVVSNMVINADQAMPEGGLISIRAGNRIVAPGDDIPLAAGKYVIISIEDKGKGIVPENLEKVFDPFFTTKNTGSGLGLSTAYSIVKKHGGCIKVESTTGVGSLFNIYLPASEKFAATEDRAVSGPYKGSGRVLLMDDEKTVCDVASKMLQSAGYEVECVPDGSETLERFARAREAGTPFDCVIMDLTIPGGMGGKQTIERLLSFDPTAKAIVSSGYSNDSVMSGFNRFGFKAALKKPYTAGEIIEVVQEVLSR